ncbi:MAG: 5-oxoprolinase/urea amidolyase family protein [Pseudomonadales bacterium]
MFDKVLIANRGAIACRIIRTLNAMGIRSVAVYSEADRDSLHVRAADESVCIGPAPAVDSYLNVARVLEAARQTGAAAIHPGYGFLSESAPFAEACAAAGIVFVGPTPAQLRSFGLKHTARRLAADAGVPLLPGSGLLDDLEHAQREAMRIGFPVMLKSTAGGGGIGMQLCHDAGELASAFDRVARLALSNFADGGIFLEKYVARARHIEVQIFGDGAGRVVALGERDCTIQRRNQKVIEETPAPGLSATVRAALMEAAVRLGEAVVYRSAGTVEFIFDPSDQAFYFLEVNTRLQVEHGVTEAVTGVDLVAWMLRAAAGDTGFLERFDYAPRGHALQVRLYAEDPGKQFQPAAGLITQLAFPADIRVDTWVETGSEVSPFYDPLLAKLICHGTDRCAALAAMQQALAATAVHGIETNQAFLAAVLADPVFTAARHYTRYLDGFGYRPHTVDVLAPGTQSTVQDHPGRVGYWNVGVPPSGPMDELAFRLGNRAVGNAPHAAGLELAVTGPTLKFNHDAVIALTGARMRATLNGQPVSWWAPVTVPAGGVLRLAGIDGPGARTYLAVRGGIDVPDYLGSKATFTLGQFGGHGGRALRAGDVLRLGGVVGGEPAAIAPGEIPEYGCHWTVGVRYGPHGAPDFFTAGDIEAFFAADWEVHYNSSRTGVRLIGPKPEWARADGGEAGLHPSNIHDNAYAIGAVDFTGDMPVILGPDGPSLGGFVCPVTIVEAELWKLGQLAPGDTVRFQRVSRAEPVLGRMAATDVRPQVCYRQAGDRYLLVEYGPLVLDLNLRFRVHALMEHLLAHRPPGMLELTPGIRSLQIHYDPAVLDQQRLVAALEQAEAVLPPVTDMRVPSRIVHLPLSWDDPSTRLAIDKYMHSVRPDAPWCPSNIEFIRRINGLESIDAVREIVFGASYLVLGLGDVYLGAPVATPIDPRHRLVTTKYNPARTWTPENAVGIGGAYLCVYGMEGPGGYQFVGRTVQMWNRFHQTREFEPGKPWLLRFFDQLRFYPVTEAELAAHRRDFLQGRFSLAIEETVLDLAEYNDFLRRNVDSIATFKNRQQSAFEAERDRWRDAGQMEYQAELPDALAATDVEFDIPAGCMAVASPVTGNVWQVAVKPGDSVAPGDALVVVEAMKMEVPIAADAPGEVVEVLCAEGGAVSAGQALVVMRPSDG